MVSLGARRTSRPFVVLALTLALGAIVGPSDEPSPRRTTGVVVAGFDANKVFIENGRYHGEKIVARLLGQQPPPDPRLSAELDT